MIDRRVACGLIGLLCAFALADCGHARLGAQRTDTLIMAISADPVSLNPLYLQGYEAGMIGGLTGSYLTGYDGRGNIVPAVAVSAPTLENGGISRDGRRLTYRLRRDVRWQDGAPLTSRDVLFTYHAVMSPSNAVLSRYGYDHIAGVEAPDPYTVVVRLRQPYAPIISNFFGGDSNYTILPAHLFAGYTNLDRAAYNSAPIGSGPYRVTGWRRSDRIEFEANPRYYGGAPAIARIVLRTVPDTSTIVNQLVTGEVDTSLIADASKILSYGRVPSHRVVITPGPYYTTLMFNVTDPLIKDVAIRKAMAVAVDRRTIVRKLFHGVYDTDMGMRGLFNWAYDPTAGSLKYDPAGARALLQRDGWTATADGIRVKDGRRLQVQIIYSGSTKVEPPAVLLLEQQERDVGIDVSIKSYSSEVMTALDGPLYRGHYQVALFAFQSQIDPDASWVISCAQRAPNGFNWARYCSPAVERALQQGYSVYDRAARRRAYAFVQRQLLRDMPYAFLWQRSEVDVIPTRLKGFAPPAYMSAYASAGRWHW